MATVDVNVSMQSGTGLGMFFKVGTQVLYFDQSGVQSMDLAPGGYVASVVGHEPSGANVTIKVEEGGHIQASQYFSSPKFAGYIPFNVY